MKVKIHREGLNILVVLNVYHQQYEKQYFQYVKTFSV